MKRGPGKDDKETISLVISKQQLKKVDEMARDAGRSRSAIIRMALNKAYPIKSNPNQLEFNF